MNKILIYRKDRQLINESIIINNQFFVDGLNDWVYYTNDWSWDSVNERVDVNLVSGATSIINYLVTPPQSLVYYNVLFDIDITGYVELYLGSNLIFSGTNLSGSYSVPFQAADFTNAQNITPTYFQLVVGDGSTASASGWFDSLQIVRDNTLSPLYDDDRWVSHAYLDMFDNVNVALNFNKETLSSFNQKNINVTKEFLIPGTITNNEIFSHLYNNGAQIVDFNPKNKTKAQIITEDGNIIFDGWLILNDIIRLRDGVNYKVQILDENYGVLDKLKNSKLVDLGFGEFNHYLTYDDVVATWDDTRTWEDGYFYPQNFKADPNIPHSIGTDFFPCFFDKMIWDKIHKYNGIDYQLSPLVDEWMDRLITTPSGKKPNISREFIEALSPSSVLVGGYNTGWGQQGLVSVNQNDRTHCEFGNPTTNNSFNQIDQINDLFTPRLTGTYTITINYTGQYGQYPWYVSNPPVGPLQPLSITDGQSSYNSTRFRASLQLVEVLSNTVIESREISYADVFDNAFTNGATPMSGIIDWSVSLVQNKQYRIDLYFENDIVYLLGGFPISFGSPQIFCYLTSTSIDFEFNNDNVIGEGAPINLGDWIPNATQYDFVNDKIKQFNMVIVPQGNNNFLYTTENEFYSPDKPILDLSGRVNLDQDINIQYLNQITSSGVEFKYQDSDEFFNDEYEKNTKGIPYHSYLFKFDTDIFSKIDTVQLKIYEPTPITTNDVGDYFSAIVAGELPKKPRNLFVSEEFLGYENTAYNVIYTNSTGGTSGVYFNQRLTALHIDKITSTKDIGFGTPITTFTLEPIEITNVNLFNKFYTQKLETYKNGRLYTVFIKLENNIVREILADPGRRIYIQELGGYFSIQKMEDYDIENGDTVTTRVELLEYIQVNDPDGITRYPDHTETEYINPYYQGGTYITNINVGDNVVYGGNNIVNNSNNTVYGNNNIVYGGSGNTVNAGVNNVFLFGVNNYTATTSNFANFFNSTFISSTGITTNNIVTSAITIGGVTLTPEILSGIPQDLQSVLNVNDVTDDGDMLRMEYTNIILSTSASTISSASTNSYVVGSTNNIYGTGHTMSIFGGSGNTMTNSIESAIISSDESIIIDGKNNTILGGSSHLLSGSSSAQLNSIMGGSSNFIYGGSRNITLGGRANSQYANERGSIITSQASILSATTGSTIIGGFSARLNNTNYSTIIGLSGYTFSGNSRMYTTPQQYISLIKPSITPHSATTANVFGTDMGGLIKFTGTSTTSIPLGQIAILTYSQPWVNGAAIVLTPANENAFYLGAYAGGDNQDVRIWITSGVTSGMTYDFNYSIIPY